MNLAYRVDPISDDILASICPFPRGIRLDAPSPVEDPGQLCSFAADVLQLPVVAFSTHVFADLSGSLLAEDQVRKMWTAALEGTGPQDEFSPGSAADVRPAGSHGSPDADPGARS